jgi:hypothetical protein
MPFSLNRFEYFILVQHLQPKLFRYGTGNGGFTTRWNTGKDKVLMSHNTDFQSPGVEEMKSSASKAALTLPD